MLTLQGIGASPGLVCGTLRFFRRASPDVRRRSVSDREGEILRFRTARAAAVAQLDHLREEAAVRVGRPEAVLFRSHQLMLEDPVYGAEVETLIRADEVCAEYAVHQAAEGYARTFAGMEDEYMRARAADVLDISRRLLRVLAGAEEELLLTGGPFILAADDLVPSETARLDKHTVLAFVTSAGSRSSHTAILARTMGIPAVVGLNTGLELLTEGTEVWVDGESGRVVCAPDTATARTLRRDQEAEEARRTRLRRYRDIPAVTREGRRVLLCANMGSPADLPAVLDCGADGVGLFRSEYLFLGRKQLPTEDEQYEAYRAAAEALGGKRVVVRTLDAGGDKRADCLDLPIEENPALGLRAIRLCLTRPELLLTQMRALYRASVHGNLAVMFPMITSLWELRRAKELAAVARAGLHFAGISFRQDMPLGIMVETPAAAVISDLLARESDFFSIGTNDLTQYTLACDRQNAALESFCDRKHEAVLRLVRMAAANGKSAGIPVGVCGELAADPDLTPFFVGAGVDELSMAPGSVPEVRAAILDGR